MLVKGMLFATLLALSSGSVNFWIVENWWNGFKVNFTLTADQALSGWTLDVKLSSKISGLQCDWVGKAQYVTENDWRVTNNDDNGNLAAGASLNNIIIVHCSSSCASETIKISDGNGVAQSNTGAGSSSGGNTGDGNTGSGNTGEYGAGTKDYADALAKSILFYDAQRSGKLPADNPIPWRHDSALRDCVVGGWYDAGDHVKFGLPFGAATHLLMWGLYKFKAGYQAAGQLQMGYDMIKWATDYMLHAWDGHYLTVQIGDGGADHAFWGRPEDMDMDRPCIKVDTAADQMGEWAAALAAGYLVFKEKDPIYADQLLWAAESMYAAGKNHPGVYWTGFYASSDYKDEMCLGAVWLYRATGDSQYLNEAEGFADSNKAWSLSWDDKREACQLLLFEETKQDSYKQNVANFLKDFKPGGSVSYTPCGLVWRDTWGATRYAGNAAFLALAAADADIDSYDNSKWAVEQINYMLGDNNYNGGCFSFEIGYGDKYPKKPHHRGASCPDPPAPCGDSQQYSGSDSPHVLYGALVGGPDKNDYYKDERTDYIMNEVAIDYNSGFHSALAGITQLEAAGKLPVAQNKCPCNA